MKRVALPFFVTLLLAIPAAAQEIRYVMPGGGGAGTCDSPFATIDDAFTWAETVPAGTQKTIRVAIGNYPEVNLNIDFSDVSLEGGYDGAEFVGGCTDGTISPPTMGGLSVIDGGLADRIMSILPDVDTVTDPANPFFIAQRTNISITGFTFANGKPAVAKNGGAIFLLNCDDITISNNVFQDNSTSGHFALGGAIYIVGYRTALPEEDRPVNVTMNDNIFTGNTAGENGGTDGSGWGGALALLDGNTVRATTVNAARNTFMNNEAYGAGDLPMAECPNGFNVSCDGGMTGTHCWSRGRGGAITFVNVGGVWDENTFDTNAAMGLPTGRVADTATGGAIYNRSFEGVSPELTNNLFTNNMAVSGAGSNSVALCDQGGGYGAAGAFQAHGGAVYSLNHQAPIVGNTFDGNVSNGSPGRSGFQQAWGGAMYVDPAGTGGFGGTGPLVIADNIFTNNTANVIDSDEGARGGALAVWDNFLPTSDPILSGNVFDGNSTDNIVGGGGAYGSAMIIQSGIYSQILDNAFTNNTASAPEGDLGGNGALWGRRLFGESIIKGNVFSGNSAPEVIAGTKLFAVAGIALRTWPFVPALGVFDNHPLIMNNLIVENDGAAIGLFGSEFDQDGDGDSEPDEKIYVNALLVNNTIANNQGVGLVTGTSDNTHLDSNIIVSNDLAGDGPGELQDGVFNGQTPSMNMTANHNIVDNFADVWATDMMDPSKFNQVAVDPLFVPAPGDYHLQHASVAGQAQSPGVNAGSSASALRIYATPLQPQGLDLNGDGTADSLIELGTNSDGEPDVLRTDIGFHYPLVPGVDTDMDGMPDAVELQIGGCLDPNDADSDDDGVLDGADIDAVEAINGMIVGADFDGDGVPSQCDCDSDGDGLTDGAERGITFAQADADTDLAATCDTSNAPLGCGSATAPAFEAFDHPTDPIAALDPNAPTFFVATDPLNPDTDGGGEWDGCEVHVFVRDPAAFVTRNASNPADDDPDRDGWNSAFETDVLTTDPFDADTDDDGVDDREEISLFPDDDTMDTTNQFVCDSDGDGLPDGLERYIDGIGEDPERILRAMKGGPVADPDGPAFPAVGTDLGAGCYLMDMGAGATHTHANVADTDGDGCSDGAEDANANGIVDPGETDPSLPGDCGSSGLSINSDITALSGGTATCGSGTVPAMADLLDGTAPCDAISDPSDYETNCPGTRVDAMAAGTINVGWDGTGTLTRPGEAVAGQFDGGASASVLVIYEMAGCGGQLMLAKNGVDLDLTLAPF